MLRVFAVDDLRGMQVLPERGAWFYSHLWMELPEGVLHQESDWMCEPNLGDSYFFTTSDGLDIRPGDPGLGSTRRRWTGFPATRSSSRTGCGRNSNNGG